MRRVAALVFMLVAAASLGACNDDDLPPATQFTPISGTVTDSVSHQPIAGATVIVDTVLTATTDANGKFTIAKVPSGIVDYIVKAKGYADLSASVNVEPGKAFDLSVAMQQPTPP
ncbi:MAG TPA: carboxypeptidase-like regulatory domain-containing protein [Candidatus Acidoferrales bacterium]|nr:carboxypeptidase-like regulatory domain-containing protein [Candidatus Acidoferrales bacterium]